MPTSEVVKPKTVEDYEEWKKIAGLSNAEKITEMRKLVDILEGELNTAHEGGTNFSTLSEVAEKRRVFAQELARLEFNQQNEATT